MPPFRPAIERFWEKVDKSGECWVWRAGTASTGYGQFYIHRRRPIPAHRYSWLLSHGSLPPPGVCVCHHCDNPPCVNPAHLFLGTQMDNAADKMRKGRHVPSIGARNGRARLCQEDVLEIRRLYAAGGSTQVQLARQFSVGQTRISRIVRMESWAHV